MAEQVVVTYNQLRTLLRDAYRDGYDSGYAHLVPADEAFNMWVLSQKVRAEHVEDSRARRPYRRAR